MAHTTNLVLPMRRVPVDNDTPFCAEPGALAKFRCPARLRTLWCGDFVHKTRGFSVVLVFRGVFWRSAVECVGLESCTALETSGQGHVNSRGNN